MSLPFAVVYEAPADFQTATDLADRVLVESIDWLDETLVAHQRTWLGHSAGGVPLTWKNIKQSALDQEAGRFPVVVGLAIVERESWVISGFDPQDEAEHLLLEAERQRLGFDPACGATN